MYEVHERMVGEEREEDGKWKKDQREGRYVVERERETLVSRFFVREREREENAEKVK